MTGELSWGLRSSFREYISMLPDGAVTAAFGARGTIDTPLVFPLDEAQYDEAARIGTVKFLGRVHIEGHGGLLSVTLEAPWIHLEGEGGRLSGLVEGRRLNLAELDAGTPERNGDLLVWSGRPIRLATDGVAWLGDQYNEGSDLDPLTWSFTHVDRPGASG